MSQIVIRIKTDNAAFENGGGDEIGRILRRIAERAEDEGGLHPRMLYDLNGNTCGDVTVTGGKK